MSLEATYPQISLARSAAIGWRADPPDEGPRMPSLLRERPLLLASWALAVALALQYLGLDLSRALASPN